MKHILMYKSVLELIAEMPCVRPEESCSIKKNARHVVDFVAKQRREGTDVMVFEGDDLSELRKLVGDDPQVMLYGAFVDGLVREAANELCYSGVEVHLHPEGCI